METRVPAAKRVVSLTEQLCSVPTEAANESAAAEILYRELSKSGAELHLEEMVEGRANLIARVPGRGERDPLVFSGHLDAALSPEGWDHDPYRPRIADGRISAAGVDDMKGAVASMAAAIEVLAQGPEPAGDVILHAVMHHDTIGLGQKHILNIEGPTSGFAICGEPSSLRINVANAGALKFRVNFYGETAHISRASDARDALKAAVNAYRAVMEMRPDHTPHPQLPHLPLLHVGRLGGGTSAGKVAPEAFFEGDLRTVPGMNRGDLRAQMSEIVAAVTPDDIGFDVRITAVQRPFVGPTGGRLIEAISAAHQERRGEALSIGVELPGEAFVTDAADLAHAGLETVVYGPGDWHFGPNQSVQISELVDAAAIYTMVARNL